MGYRKPDLQDAYFTLRKSMSEIRSPYNDGWLGSTCKHELFLLKCWLEDEYQKLPKFDVEREWEQQRLVDKLRK